MVAILCLPEIPNASASEIISPVVASFVETLTVKILAPLRLLFSTKVFAPIGDLCADKQPLGHFGVVHNGIARRFRHGFMVLRSRFSGASSFGKRSTGHRGAPLHVRPRVPPSEAHAASVRIKTSK